MTWILIILNLFFIYMNDRDPYSEAKGAMYNRLWDFNFSEKFFVDPVLEKEDDEYYYFTSYSTEPTPKALQVKIKISKKNKLESEVSVYGNNKYWLSMLGNFTDSLNKRMLINLFSGNYFFDETRNLFDSSMYLNTDLTAIQKEHLSRLIQLEDGLRRFSYENKCYPISLSELKSPYQVQDVTDIKDPYGNSYYYEVQETGYIILATRGKNRQWDIDPKIRRKIMRTMKRGIYMEEDDIMVKLYVLGYWLEGALQCSR